VSAEAAEATEAEPTEKEEEEAEPVYGNSVQQRTIRLQRFIARAETVPLR
jgi:hypothetical protein